MQNKNEMNAVISSLIHMKNGEQEDTGDEGGVGGGREISVMQGKEEEKRIRNPSDTLHKIIESAALSVPG